MPVSSQEVLHTDGLDTPVCVGGAVRVMNYYCLVNIHHMHAQPAGILHERFAGIDECDCARSDDTAASHGMSESCGCDEKPPVQTHAG